MRLSTTKFDNSEKILHALPMAKSKQKSPLGIRFKPGEREALEAIAVAEDRGTAYIARRIIGGMAEGERPPVIPVELLWNQILDDGGHGLQAHS